MDQSFAEQVCIKQCPHFMCLGNGIKGGFRMLACYYRRDSTVVVNERRRIKRVLLTELTECPDLSKKNLVVVISGRS